MAEHRVTAFDEGMYAYAVCSCGWASKAECEPERAVLAAASHKSGLEKGSRNVESIR